MGEKGYLRILLVNVRVPQELQRHLAAEGSIAILTVEGRSMNREVVAVASFTVEGMRG